MTIKGKALHRFKEGAKMLNNVKLGIAPIAWTNDDLPELGGEIPFERCISEMAEAGFQGSEVGNKYPRDPAVLKKSLKPLGLQIASAWLSVYFTEDGREDETLRAFDAHARFLKEMGAKVIVVCECGHCIQGKPLPVLGKDKPVFTQAQWKRLFAGLEEIGKMAGDIGMKIVYHHYMGTGVQTRSEIDKLMEGTDPALVYLLSDTGHITFSGDSALSVIKDYVTRIKHVHLKDIRPSVLKEVKAKGLSFLDAVKAGVFTVPGDGCIDYKPIFKVLSDNAYEGWFIVEAEQDPVRANPLEYAKKAYKYITETIKEEGLR
jgi:inosose dehydratase